VIDFVECKWCGSPVIDDGGRLHQSFILSARCNNETLLSSKSMMTSTQCESTVQSEVKMLFVLLNQSIISLATHRTIALI
jgi:hypothetical protein